MNAYILVTESVASAKKRILEILNQLESASYENLQMPDFFSSENLPDLGIKELRSLKQFFSRRPFQLKGQYAMIWPADTLSPPAQNSLLKTLEELAVHQYVWLVTARPMALLDTIRSRAWQEKLISPKTTFTYEKEQKIFQDLLCADTVGQKLKTVEGIVKKRDEALSFCLNMLFFLRKRLLEDKKNERSAQRYLEKMLLCYGQIRANCHIQLALDLWAISIKKVACKLK